MWHFRTGFSLSVHVSFKMKSGIRILPYVIFVRIKWTNRKESWIKPNGERIRNPKLPTEDLSLSTIMISLLHNENILKERSILPVSSIACSWRNFVNKTFIFVRSPVRATQFSSSTYPFMTRVFMKRLLNCLAQLCFLWHYFKF